MKNTMKKFLSLVLTVIMLFSVVPMTNLGIEANAASNIIINGVNIGYAEGSYFTKDGKSCATTAFSNGRCHKHDICEDATDSRCNCMRYWPSISNCKVDLLASQCFGFARYCQWRVYGYHDGNSKSKFTNLTGTISASNCTASTLKSKLSGCAPATHIRTGDGEHSISIISVDDANVRVADCNRLGYCKIQTYSYTWSSLATYLKGRGGIEYAYSAKSATVNPPVAEEEIDTHIFDAKFEVMASSKTVRSEPYGTGTKVKTVSKGDTVTVKAYLYNDYGNLWYKTSSGDYIHSEKLLLIENDSLSPSNYIEAKFKVMCSSKPIRKEPISSSEKLDTVSKDDTVSVIGYMYNEYGSLWYVCEDEGYISHDYLSVISSSSRTPSNYLSETLNVKGDKVLRSKPYGSADEVSRIEKGETLKVIGYVYNKWGNLWYYSSDKNYTYHSYLEQSSSSSKAPSNYIKRDFKLAEDKNARNEPYSVAEKNRSVSKGTTVSTIGQVTNLYGNTWYLTTDEDYLSESNLTCVHVYTSKVTKNATCTATGVKTFTCKYCGNKYTETIAKTSHSLVTDKAVAATCTKTGLTEGKHCSVCGTVTVAQKTVAKKAHTEVVDKAVAATCTKTGLTEGKHCSVCGAVTVAQKTVAKTPHNKNTTIPAVSATCTKTGLTEGKKCSVCGTTTVAQQTIAKKAHNSNTTIPAVSATCTKTGLTEGKKCSLCGTITVAQQTIAKKAHTEVIDKAVSATCTKTGLTEGKHCSVCNAVTVAQQTVSVVAHKDSNSDYKCDYGCGYAFEKPADPTPDTPDTPEVPDEPAKDCSCNCHKGGIAGFFFKIINFFQKLFGMNKVCACGVKH